MGLNKIELEQTKIINLSFSLACTLDTKFLKSLQKTMNLPLQKPELSPSSNLLFEKPTKNIKLNLHISENNNYLYLCRRKKERKKEKHRNKETLSLQGLLVLMPL